MRWSSYLSLREEKLKTSAEWGNHFSCWCFVRIAQGYGYWLEQSTPRDVSEGDVLIIPSSSRGVFRVSLLSPVRLEFFLWKPEPYAQFLTHAEQQFFSTAEKTIRCFPSASDLAASFATAFAKAKTTACFSTRVQLFSLVAEAFVKELAQLKLLEGNDASVAERFKNAMERITDSELMKMDADDLSRRCNCSMRHFSRLFQERFGVSLRERQKSLRLEKASQLLRDTDAKVLNIATESGYRNLGLFNTMFKKHKGMTPTQWRTAARQLSPQ